MGTGASRKTELKQKIKAIGTFEKHVQPEQRPMSADELQEFVKNQRMLRMESLNYDETEETMKRFRRRKSSLQIDQGKFIHMFNHATVEHDTKCHICDTCVPFLPIKCRVCSKVFHKECLLASNECRDKNIMLLANSNMGWSCYLCSNLGLLLTSDEMNDLINAYEKYDINKDCSISLEEYLDYLKKKYYDTEGVPMPLSEIELEQTHFRLMDADSSGTIDWFEFMNDESIRALAKREKETLLDLLTASEVAHARSVFKSMDQDGDGVITESEAKTMYRNWYSKISQMDPSKLNTSPTKPLAPAKSDSFDQHVEQQTRILMMADTRDVGSVSWEEYLKDQAINIISARPNRPAGKLAEI